MKEWSNKQNVSPLICQEENIIGLLDPFYPKNTTFSSLMNSKYVIYKAGDCTGFFADLISTQSLVAACE